MKLHLDPQRCQGHGRCEALAPELFRVDDLGMSSALNNGDVPAGLEAKARLCVDSCPEMAIHLDEATPPAARTES